MCRWDEVAQLYERPIRSLISITAIAVEVTLILVIVGLSMGILNDSKLRTAGWVRVDDLLKVDSIEHMISHLEFGAMQVFTGAQDKGFTHL